MADIGARDPKKPDDEKSKVFRFRLHPQSEDQAEVSLYRELYALLDKRGNIRQYLIDLYRKAEKMPEKSKPMPMIDTRKIMTKLDKVMSYLKNLSSGAVNVSAVESPDYNDDFLSSLDRMLDAGLEASDTDEPTYYDLDE